MKKQVKSKQSFDGLMLNFRNEARHYRTVDKPISNLMIRIDSSNVKKYMKELLKNKFIADKIFENVNMKSIKSYNENSNFDNFGNFEKELIWYSTIVSNFYDKLNVFFGMEQKFDRAILLSNYDEAHKILEDIKNEFGESLWYVEKKISIYSLESKTKEKSEFVGTYNNNKEMYQLFKFLIYYYSFKGDNNISYSMYQSRISSVIAEYSGGLSAYIRFKLEMESDYVFTDVDLSYILNKEIKFSLVDCYFTFLRVLHIIIQQKSIKQIKILEKVFENFSNELNDNRVLNVKRLFINRADIFNDIKLNLSSKIMDMYTVGNYSEAVKTVEDNLSKIINDFDIIEVYVKSILRLNINLINKSCVPEKTEIYNIATYMMSILKKDEYYKDAEYKLLKISMVNSSSSWAIKLLYFIKENYEIYGQVGKSKVFGLLNSIEINPKLYKVLLDKEDSRLFLSNLVIACPSFITASFFNSLFTNNFINIFNDKERFLRYTADNLMNKNDFIGAKEIYERLLISEIDLLTKYESIANIIKCYINLEEFDNAANKIVESYFENENLLNILPIKEFLNIIEIDVSKYDALNIDIPIIYELYTKHIAADKNEIKTEVIDEFIISQELKLPSEFKCGMNETKSNKLVFFLKEVCNEKVLEGLTYLTGGSNAVKTERIDILTVLLNNDKENEKNYFEEIGKLQYEIYLNKLITKVSKSRINIKREEIKKLVDLNIREKYYKYENLVVKYTVDRVVTQIKEIIDISQGVLEIPKDYTSSVFNDIYKEFRHYFLFGDNGLDYSLSVNIRHGSIEGELRSVFEKNNLISYKSFEDSTYKYNSKWLSNFELKEKESIVLKEFSRDLDAIIDDLKDNWIQVEIDKKNSTRLFDFTSNEKEIVRLREDITRGFLNKSLENVTENYELFFDSIYGHFIDKTKISLAKVSSSIKNDLKIKILKLLERLAIKAEAINNEKLRNAITQTNSEIQWTLDNLAEWFEISEDNLKEDYTLRTAINISKITIEKMFSSFDFTKFSIISDDVVKLKGSSLPSLVNVFNILLQNTIKHNKKIEGVLEVKLDKNRCEISINCKIDSTVDLDLERDKLSKAINEMEQGLNVRKEVQSGFQKINKIILYDFYSRYSREFKITDDYSFVGKISFDIERIKA